MKKVPEFNTSARAVSIPASGPEALPVTEAASNEETFWITNISNRNVSLGDLNLTVKAYMTVNLLDSRHYHLTSAQLHKSAKSGSIYAKRNMIFVRLIPPEKNKIQSILTQENWIPSRARSAIPTIQPNYDELNLSDEAFAEEASELVEKDRKPLISK
jgi:hypothetical protein